MVKRSPTDTTIKKVTFDQSIESYTKTIEGIREHPTGTCLKTPSYTTNIDKPTQSSTELSTITADKNTNPSLTTPLTTTCSKTPTLSHLIRTITEIVNAESVTPTKSIFRFENSEKAAAFNSKLLRSMRMDFHKVIHAQGNSFLRPGSEFRNPLLLEKLLHNHERWNKLKRIMTTGAAYSFKKDSIYSEETRLKDLACDIKRGNNASTKIPENDKALRESYSKEVEKGWLIPFLREDVIITPGASVIPAGMATQYTITSKGDRVIKRRPTHDASRPSPSGVSVNLRCNKDDLDESLFGYCLIRILNHIHALKIKFPHDTIVINKTDLDSAYRRLHVMIKFALICVTIIDRIAYLLARLPFGSTPAADEFCTCSETIADIAQWLTEDPTWIPSQLKSPLSHLIPDPEPISPPAKPIDPPLPLAIPLDPKPIQVDVYIDDIITTAVHTPDFIERAKQAVPLAIHTIFRPVSPLEPIQRDWAISVRKLLGDGRLEHSKSVLGWIINTKTFKIHLEQTKHSAWQKDIEDVISSKEIKAKPMEQLIGKLNHVGFIIPIGRYFLNRLRYRQKQAERYGSSTLRQWDIEDLILWQKLLHHATYNGIRIDHVSFSLPSTFCISDASETGMGGFSSEGFAWRWQIPHQLQQRVSINLLEFIAACVTAEFTLKALTTTNSTRGIRVMSLTDNSSALGWLHHSTFNPVENPMHDVVARRLATQLFSHNSSLFAQHIPGNQNIIADSLSRDFTLSEQKLTNHLHNTLQKQVPDNFRIYKLDQETISWIESVLLGSTYTEGSQQQPEKSKPASSTSGENSSEDAESKMSSSLLFRHKEEARSRVRTRTKCETIALAARLGIPFDAEQLCPPSQMWLRPSKSTTGPTLQQTPSDKEYSR